MRRPIRFAKGGIYHVFNRGALKTDIFADTDDAKYFMHKACEIAPLYAMSIIAITVMTNHYHLVLRQNGDTAVSDFMQRIGYVYSRRYNRYHNNKGTIFQGRFGASVISGMMQLWYVCRYVYMNPVVARIVTHPRYFQFTNYLEVTQGGPFVYADAQAAIELIGDLEKFAAYVDEGVSEFLHQFESENCHSGAPP